MTDEDPALRAWRQAADLRDSARQVVDLCGELYATQALEKARDAAEALDDLEHVLRWYQDAEPAPESEGSEPFGDWQTLPQPGRLRRLLSRAATAAADRGTHELLQANEVQFLLAPEEKGVACYVATKASAVRVEDPHLALPGIDCPKPFKARALLALWRVAPETTDTPEARVRWGRYGTLEIRARGRSVRFEPGEDWYDRPPEIAAPNPKGVRVDVLAGSVAEALDKMRRHAKQGHAEIRAADGELRVHVDQTFNLAGGAGGVAGFVALAADVEKFVRVGVRIERMRAMMRAAGGSVRLTLTPGVRVWATVEGDRFYGAFRVTSIAGKA